MPNWKKLIVSGSDAALNNLNVANAVTASFLKGDGSAITNIQSSSYALTASYALNGGGGGSAETGSLLVTASAIGNTITFTRGDSSTFDLDVYAADVSQTATVSATFSNTTSETFLHNFGTRNVIVSVYDNNFNQILPQNVNLYDINNVTVDFAVSQSGTVVIAKGGHIVSGSTFIADVAAASDTYSNVVRKVIPHNFNTKDVIVSVYNDNDQVIIPQSITTTTLDSVTVELSATGSGRVVVAKAGHVLSASVNYSDINNIPENLLSGSDQIASQISGSFTLLSSSIATRFDGLTSDYTELSNIPNGIISSSSQIESDITGSFTLLSESIATRFDGLTSDYTELSNIPNGIISSSNQIQSDITGSFNLLSSSIATRFDGLTSDYTELTNIPNGIVSSSIQIASDISGSFTLVSSSIVNTLSTKLGRAETGSFAKTDINNTFTGTQTFNNINITGTGSFGLIQSITGSAKIIGDSYIVLNANTPAQQFSGIKVIDSGSSDTGSLEYDSISNHWFYQSTNEGYASGFISGPRSTRGSIQVIPNNTIPVGDGGNHITSSNITDNGATVKINSNTEVTGSLTVTGTITGDGSGLTGITVQENATITDTFSSVTSKAVNHAFNTKNVLVSVYNDSDQLIVPASITTTDVNNVTVTFDFPTSGRVVVGKAGHIISGSLGSYRETVSGNSSYTLTHNLNEDFPLVQSYESESREQIIPKKIKSNSSNEVLVEFDLTFSGTIIVKK